VTRFCVDYLEVLLDLLRAELPGVRVMCRTGGDSAAPEFYDQPWVNVQCWCVTDPVTGIDQFEAASDLADQVRRVLWTAYRTQQIVPGKGWIGYIRESSAPQEVSDPDRPFVGRYAATYELRVRPLI
jgi:hypothetical protein